MSLYDPPVLHTAALATATVAHVGSLAVLAWAARRVGRFTPSERRSSGQADAGAHLTGACLAGAVAGVLFAASLAAQFFEHTYSYPYWEILLTGPPATEGQVSVLAAAIHESLLWVGTLFELLAAGLVWRAPGETSISRAGAARLKVMVGVVGATGTASFMLLWSAWFSYRASI